MILLKIWARLGDINLGLGISVHGLVSSTLAKLQAITLTLECIPKSHSVCLFSDKLNLMYSDFRNQCWVKCWHISNIICSKNLRVIWHKVKSHSGILGNNCADSLADATSLLDVSDNSRYFVWDVFCAVCHMRWKIGSGSGFLVGGLLSDVNWLSSFWVWHSNLHMAIGFTNRCTLLIAVRKHLYDKCYSSILCLYCGEVKMFDHVFSCMINISACHKILESCTFSWRDFSGYFLPLSSVLQLLSVCALDFLVFSAFFKSFVFNGWFSEAVSVFNDSKVAKIKVAEFVYSLCLTFRDDIWVVHVKHHTFMKKHGLIPIDDFALVSVSGSALKFSAGVVKLLGISEAFGVGILVSVNITA
ncbi:hypothetical protein G9A89_022085 [Geosiphon pyriformis]|nr:hypothetical protein G9A89_022085 [Geosiphon pyriformis]